MEGKQCKMGVGGVCEEVWGRLSVIIREGDRKFWINRIIWIIMCDLNMKAKKKKNKREI